MNRIERDRNVKLTPRMSAYEPWPIMSSHSDCQNFVFVPHQIVTAYVTNLRKPSDIVGHRAQQPGACGKLAMPDVPEQFARGKGHEHDHGLTPADPFPRPLDRAAKLRRDATAQVLLRFAWTHTRF